MMPAVQNDLQFWSFNDILEETVSLILTHSICTFRKVHIKCISYPFKRFRGFELSYKWHEWYNVLLLMTFLLDHLLSAADISLWAAEYFIRIFSADKQAFLYVLVFWLFYGVTRKLLDCWISSKERGSCLGQLVAGMIDSDCLEP